VGFYPTDDSVYGLAVRDNYLYFGNGGEFLTLDVSTPSDPQEVALFNTDAVVSDIALIGNYAYVANDYHGLRIIDVSTPSAPEEVGRYYTSYARGVSASGNYAFVADYLDGLYIIQNDLLTTGIRSSTQTPENYALRQNYPNPFNPTTTLRYDLPEQGFVHLTIYNQLGKPIRTLINREESAGYKSVMWDARDDYGKQVSTGIYFYRIEVNGFSQTKKMVLLK